MNRRALVLPLSLGLSLAAACGGGDTESPTSTSGGGQAGSGGQGSSSSSSSTSSGTGGGQGGQGGSSTVCSPGEQKACYTGPFGTEGVGICHGGMATCAADGSGFGACAGEVLPADETCNTIEDDDCDGMVNEEGAGCTCIPGSVTTCYSGPPGTEGVGLCIAGILTCLPDGTGYGPCTGEVTPAAENCATPEDEDCDGQTPLCPALWARRFGDSQSQFAWAVAASDDGGAYALGDLSGVVDFGAGPLTSAGSSDVFLTRLGPDGSTVWSKSFGNNSLQSGQAIAADAAGNVVITGYFQGAITFGTTALTTSGGADIFVAKFDAGGGHLWSKKFGSATDDQLGLSVALDATGNVLLTGALTGTIGFGGTNLVSAGGADVFVVKLDPAGNHLWSKRFGDAGQSQNGRAITSDAQGNVIVAGEFDATVNFGGAALTSAGNTDVFLAKLDPSGNHLWSKAFGDPAFQIARGVTAGAGDSITVVGDLAGSVDFGGGALGAKGQTDGFVASFAADGTHAASVLLGGPDYDSARSVHERAGVLVVTGYFAGAADFGGQKLQSAGGRDVFLTRLDPATLSTVWARGFGDVAFYQSGESVRLDPTGNLIVGGYHYGTIDFGAGPLVSAGDADAFVARFAP